jgi:hydrocephalus-inducing protein
MISPMAGVVPPNGSLPLEVTFGPTAEETYNTTLLCRVKKAIAPLTCNIKGEGYTTHDSLRFQSADGPMTTLSPDEVGEIDIGQVLVNSRTVRKFVVTNQGRFNLDFKWTVPTVPFLTLNPMIGTVAPNSDAIVELVYAPQKEVNLANALLTCKVTNGKSYSVRLTGNAAVPNVSLSWKEHDFGPTFVQMPGQEVAVKILSIVNRDKTSLAVDCLFDNKEHMELDATSFVLEGGEKKDLKVSFMPRDQIMYQETINFTFNDLATSSVVVRGEGTTPKIEVLTRQLRFGVCRIGERKEMEVRVVCRSRIPTPVSIQGCLPVDLVRHGITVQPDAPLLMKPKEMRAFVFAFKPAMRLPQFTSDVKLRVAGQEIPFVQVSGSCHGAEAHLDTKSLNFGSVVVGTKVTRRVIIMNTGDIGLKFKWTDRLPAEFKLSPSEGFIAPHSDETCELTFSPTEAGRDYKRDNIEVKFSDAPPLSFGIASAVGARRPEPAELVTFATRVRETTVAKVHVRNDGTEPWTIRPQIDNPVFTAPEQLVIRPKEVAECPITYAPMTCTKLRDEGGQTDTGMVFFPLPNGTALQYRLEGTSDLPAPNGTIERDLSAKVLHAEKLIVQNWLKVPQRFTVAMTFAGATDDSVSIRGVSSLDVPPLSSREFKLQAVAYREGRISGTVRFTNEKTHEYQFYYVTFNVKASKEVASIDIKTNARVRKTYEVTMTNPLPKQVTLVGKSDCPDLLVAPTTVLPPKATVKVPVDFFPLLAKETYPPAKLSFQCPELGEFPFVVQLSALPPLPEKPTRVQVALGQRVVVPLRFTHYAKANVDYQLRFSDPKQNVFGTTGSSFKVTAAADPRAGAAVSCDVVYFEPQRIGEYRETVELVSAAGGTFSFPLHGTCTPPQRQGPIDVRPNQTASVTFRNVFSETVVFSFASDSPAFVPSKQQESIAAKKNATVTVQYRPTDATQTTLGKLLITGTPTSTGDPQPVTWVYYLRGADMSEQPPTTATGSRGASRGGVGAK